jgi:very-short-patch-repair endonuclease
MTRAHRAAVGRRSTGRGARVVRVDAEIERMLRLGPVLVSDAMAAGISRGRLRTADRPFRGVAARSGEDRLASISARLGGQQFLSHTSAAAVWGIRLPRRDDAPPVHVSAIAPHDPPRLRGVVGHRLHDDRVETTLFAGVRLTTPTETWRHLSTVLALDDLVVAGDSLVRRRDPLATPAELLRALARHGGMRGARRLRQAWALVRPGTDSAAETRLRLILVRGGLPEPAVNPRIELTGYGPALLDLAYPDRRIAVEFDGVQHRTDARQFERDVLRHERLAACGWRVIRILAAHLASPAAVVARVHDALDARESSVRVETARGSDPK